MARCTGSKFKLEVMHRLCTAQGHAVSHSQKSNTTWRKACAMLAIATTNMAAKTGVQYTENLIISSVYLYSATLLFSQHHKRSNIN